MELLRSSQKVTKVPLMTKADGGWLNDIQWTDEL